MNNEFDKIFNKWIYDSIGLNKYLKIMDMFNKVNVSKNIEFQTLFNGYYRVRRNQSWRYIYYDFFEKNKNNSNIAFKDILIYIEKRTGKVEASFSSKMLHTINPNMPILDQYVLKNMGLAPVSGNNNDEKIKCAIETYDSLIKRYNELCSSERGKYFIKKFDEIFKDNKLTKTRKLDCILVGLRDL